MIPWDGEEMHEDTRDNEDDQCVNCTALAGENGWCADCWRDIVGDLRVGPQAGFQLPVGGMQVTDIVH